MLSLTLVYTTKYIGDGDDVILEKKKIIILEPPIKNSIYNVKLLYNISYPKLLKRKAAIWYYGSKYYLLAFFKEKN